MDNQDQRHGAVNRIVVILRKATRIVQLIPFFYLVAFALCLFISLFCNEFMVGIFDALLTITPVTTGTFLVLSKLFRLCRWHKAACLLPTIPQAESAIDTYLITFTQVEVICMHILLCIIVALFLVKAYRHFFYGRKAIS